MVLCERVDGEGFMEWEVVVGGSKS